MGVFLFKTRNVILKHQGECVVNITTRLFLSDEEKEMEARPGVEPRSTDLQSAA